MNPTFSDSELDATMKRAAPIRKRPAVDRTPDVPPADVPLHPEIVDGAPIVVCMADVQSKPVDWLWPGRIPRRCVTVLAGRPGDGKSFATADWAARVSTGQAWPDGAPCEPGGVLLVSAEDDPETVLRPRLDSHDANVSRVYLLRAVHRVQDGRIRRGVFTLADLPALESALRRVTDPKLCIIDPIGSFLGGNVDAHRDNEVREVLAPISLLAEQLGIAVLVVAHHNKSNAAHADDLILGSRAFSGLARAVIHLMRDPENEERRLILPGKMNVARSPGGLAFGIDGDPARLHWEDGIVSDSADGVLAAIHRQGRGGRTERDDAAGLLRDLLANGPRPARDVERDARDAGYSIATVRRAKAAIGVVSRKPAFGGPWEWTLPAEDAQRPKILTEDAHTPPSEHLGEKQAEIDGNPPKMLNGGGVSALGDGERLRNTATNAGDGGGAS